MPSRIRIRTRKVRTAAMAEDNSRLGTLVGTYLDNIDEIHKLEAGNEALLEEASTLMKARGLTEYRTATGEAEFYAPTTRGKTVIDPRKFFSTVQNKKDFYSAISVSVTKAREVLSEKEIASISEIYSAKAKERVLRIRRKKA